MATRTWKTPLPPPPRGARGGAHRRQFARARWGIVATVCVLLFSGAGLAAAQLAGSPEPKDATEAADASAAADESSHDAGSSSSSHAPTSRPSKSANKPSHKPSTHDSSSKPADRYAQLRDDVVALVNKERASAGCGEVHVDGRLVAAATGHSKDMAANGYFDHNSQDGRTFTDRASDEGYDSAIGENIAEGQTTADDVMNAWMNSDGHRANIVNCDAKAIGMGVADAADGSRYWTQDFGSV